MAFRSDPYSPSSRIGRSNPWPSGSRGKPLLHRFTATARWPIAFRRAAALDMISIGKNVQLPNERGDQVYFAYNLRMDQKQSLLQNQLTTWFKRQTAPSGVRRVAPLGSALATEIGEVRAENQDRVAIARGRDARGRPFSITAVADGIGGMRDGASCAALAIGSLFAAVAEEAQVSEYPSSWLIGGFEKSNMAVHSAFQGQGGSTLVAVLIAGDGSAFCASVGDSRVYQTDRTKIIQLSMDDTIAGQLGRGQPADPAQSKLLQFIGMGASLELSASGINPANGETLLMTTDGTHLLDSTPWFAQIIRHAQDPGLCARRLVELSKWCGGPDNATAAIATLGAPLGDGLPDLIGSLEVWDPFGELQIILEPRSGSVSSNHRGARISDQSAHGSSRGAAPTDFGRPPVGSAPEKQKKSRGPRKSKSASTPAKSNKRESASEDAKVPQLLIEFPNKAR